MFKIRLAKIERGDIVNCPDGLGLTIWFQGCTIGCKGCHNPALIDFMGGNDVSVRRVVNVIKDNISWLSDGMVIFLGGEPTDQFVALKRINDACQSMGIRTMLYTGREVADLHNYIDPREFDYVKAGSYKEELRSDGEYSSTNQVLIKRGATLCEQR